MVLRRPFFGPREGGSRSRSGAATSRAGGLQGPSEEGLVPENCYALVPFTAVLTPTSICLTWLLINGRSISGLNDEDNRSCSPFTEWSIEAEIANYCGYFSLPSSLPAIYPVRSPGRPDLSLCSPLRWGLTPQQPHTLPFTHWTASRLLQPYACPEQTWEDHPCLKSRPGSLSPGRLGHRQPGRREPLIGVEREITYLA